jgi:hypothetical protein
MKESESDLTQKMLEAVGKPVNFRYPTGEGHKNGILRDRTVFYSGTGSTGVPYWDVVDLIEFPEEPEPFWIRIGYYRKPKDKLNWAGQTTITEPVGTWRKLLVHSAREKVWFRKLIMEVAEEVKSVQALVPSM